MELQITTFYTQIKACLRIDLRDQRGKIHEAALVLVQLVLALLCNRDGNMSRIHEHMELRYAELVTFLGLENAPARSISRAQLPLFLSKKALVRKQLRAQHKIRHRNEASMACG